MKDRREIFASFAARVRRSISNFFSDISRRSHFCSRQGCRPRLPECSQATALSEETLSTSAPRKPSTRVLARCRLFDASNNPRSQEQSSQIRRVISGTKKSICRMRQTSTMSFGWFASQRPALPLIECAKHVVFLARPTRRSPNVSAKQV